MSERASLSFPVMPVPSFRHGCSSSSVLRLWTHLALCYSDSSSSSLFLLSVGMRFGMMFETEDSEKRRYREFGQQEMKRLKVDLDRRIHDQKFAREIMNIPDGDWTKYSDKFEKPYSLGASSSSSSAAKVPFVCLFLQYFML
ncbi:unnamed protein product [Arabis nemorensis]|uniref:Uncharacterized protein n=1 Tax=Arabis nemorensis TaxID=586526 RepID=A0A565CH84_9BRAS|nr:unnamed protein product [Arabis nemorensis]